MVTSSTVMSNWRSSPWARGAAHKATSAASLRMFLRLMVSFSSVAAELAQVGDDVIDITVAEVSVPVGHQHRLVHRLAAFLDGLEQLFVGAGSHLVLIGMVARLHGQLLGVDTVAVARDAVALGAVGTV